MAEELTEEMGGQETPPADTGAKLFTQEEVDALIKKRIDKQNLKHAEELASRDEQLKAAQDEASKYKSQVEETERNEERKKLIREVMEKHRVDAKYASLLTADTEEELDKQAALIGEKFADPVPSDTGKPPHVSDSDADKKAFARELFGGHK